MQELHHQYGMARVPHVRNTNMHRKKSAKPERLVVKGCYYYYRSAGKICPPILSISASGKIGMGVILRKYNFLENRPTLQTDLKSMLVFSRKRNSKIVCKITRS